jgi:uncharacterized protein (TIGR02996 family)
MMVEKKQSLLIEVLRNPQDKAGWLVFSDFLEETGSEQADIEFCRVVAECLTHKSPRVILGVIKGVQPAWIKEHLQCSRYTYPGFDIWLWVRRQELPPQLLKFLKQHSQVFEFRFTDLSDATIESIHYASSRLLENCREFSLRHCERWETWRSTGVGEEVWKADFIMTCFSVASSEHLWSVTIPKRNTPAVVVEVPHHIRIKPFGRCRCVSLASEIQEAYRDSFRNLIGRP